MELDKRIIDRKYIYDCFNADMAKEFIGEDCYMTNDLELYKDLDRLTIYHLDRIDDNSFFYNAEDDEYFDFCLPVRWLNSEEKQKQYRPFKDTKEFFIKTNYENGDLIHIRFKNKIEYWVMLVGWTNNGILLGTQTYTFDNLFENFELWDGENNFIPFGVEEE